MTLIYKDRVAETTDTTGNLTYYTLKGAKTGYQSFSSIGNGNDCIYCCTNGIDWEVGTGKFYETPVRRLERVCISSSNNNQLVNWGSGTKNIFLTAPSSHIDNWQSAFSWGDHASAGYAPGTRNISTTSPLSGGGQLTNDLTLSIPEATANQSGYLNYLTFLDFNSRAKYLFEANNFLGTGDFSQGTTNAYVTKKWASGSTSNATPVKLTTGWSPTVATESAWAIFARICGLTNQKEIGHYHVIATLIKGVTGQLEFAATPTISFSEETLSGLAATLVIDNNQIYVQVTGTADREVNWTAEVNIVEVAPDILGCSCNIDTGCTCDEDNGCGCDGDGHSPCYCDPDYACGCNGDTPCACNWDGGCGCDHDGQVCGCNNDNGCGCDGNTPCGPCNADVSCGGCNVDEPCSCDVDNGCGGGCNGDGPCTCDGNTGCQGGCNGDTVCTCNGNWGCGCDGDTPCSTCNIDNGCEGGCNEDAPCTQGHCDGDTGCQGGCDGDLPCTCDGDTGCQGGCDGDLPCTCNGDWGCNGCNVDCADCTTCNNDNGCGCNGDGPCTSPGCDGDYGCGCDNEPGCYCDVDTGCGCDGECVDCTGCNGDNYGCGACDGDAPCSCEHSDVGCGGCDGDGTGCGCDGDYS